MSPHWQLPWPPQERRGPVGASSTQCVWGAAGWRPTGCPCGQWGGGLPGPGGPVMAQGISVRVWEDPRQNLGGVPVGAWGDPCQNLGDPFQNAGGSLLG